MKIFLKTFFLALVITVISSSTWAQTTSQAFAYVTNRDSNTVSVINTANNNVVKEIGVGITPYAVAITPDGNYAYVVNNESPYISVIDTYSNSVVKNVPAAYDMTSIAITHDGSFALVTRRNLHRLLIIDIATDQTVSQIELPRPYDVAVTPDGTLAFVVLPFNNAVAVVDLNTRSVTGWINVAYSPLSIAINHQGNIAYVGHPNPSQVTVIDVGSRTILTEVPMTPGANAVDIAFTPDDRYAYVTNGSHNTITVIDTLNNTVDSIFGADCGLTSGIAFTEDGGFAYVVCGHPLHSAVSVIDTHNNGLVHKIAVGKYPRAIAITPARQLQVLSIDIKPYSYPNNINPYSKGVITVAIFTTSVAQGDPYDFDATQVNTDTVAFGPNGAAIAHKKGHINDVDDDGDMDLVLHFRTQETSIACGDTESSLTGETYNGQTITATDSIRTVGCK